MQKTILFIHGMFMNPKSWSGWVNYFSQRGYTVYAPAWPYHEGEPEVLRNNIDAQLGNLNLQRVVSVFESYVNNLKIKPVIIGHSMGALVTQILINKDMGSAGICIDSAPPKGVLSFKWSFIKSNLPAINPLKGNAPAIMSRKHYQYAFCNTMSREDSDKIYNEYVIPESRNVPRSSTGKAGYINFKKPHAPLLFIAGEKDNIIPASLNKLNAKKYKKNSGITDFKMFEGRTHIICNQPGWEQVAEYIAMWIEDKTKNQKG